MSLKPGIPWIISRTPCAEKSDKLGWEAGFALDLGGFVVGIRCNDQQALELIRPLIPNLGTPTDTMESHILISYRRGGEGKRKGSRNFHIVYRGWDTVVRTLDEAEALRGFEQLCLSEMVVPRSRGEAVFSPGTALYLGERGIVLVGSEAKRNAMSVALQDRGFALASSRFIVIDQSGELLPCPGLGEAPRIITLEDVFPRVNVVAFLEDAPPAMPTTPGTSTIRLLSQTYGTGHPYSTMRMLAKGLEEAKCLSYDVAKNQDWSKELLEIVKAS